jgi:two-component system nitrogen regulation response regulator GlnG
MGNTVLTPVLLVDDEPQFLQSASVTLQMAGFETTTLTDGNLTTKSLAEKKYSVILLDIMMPGCSGIDILQQVVKSYPEIPVIMLTAVNEIETAVHCMRCGAFDYAVKPVERERLITIIQRAVEVAQVKTENRKLRQRLLENDLENPWAFEEIVTRNARIHAIFQYVDAIAQTTMPVLITGETGSGKELFAKAVHKASGRSGEFVSVNIAGLNDTLFSDALFGHERGAYTGATTKRDGLIAKASGGTIFLDEIGDLAFDSQVKLLRVLEDRTYYPLGSDSIRSCTARFVVATNVPLNHLRKKGNFREDLYYRLESHQITIPPLRERLDDIQLLVKHFLNCASQEIGKELPPAPSRFYEELSTYSFPGNIRELRNMIYDIAGRYKGGDLEIDPIIDRIRNNNQTASDGNSVDYIENIPTEGFLRWKKLPALKEAERFLINEALKRAGGNQTIAARLLGMNRSALNKRLIRSESDNQELIEN